MMVLIPNKRIHTMFVEKRDGSKVEVTQEMIDLMVQRFHLDPEGDMNGVIGTIALWVKGVGEMDAYLSDSPEGREAFKEVRAAYLEAHGAPTDAPLSNVTLADADQEKKEEAA